MREVTRATESMRRAVRWLAEMREEAASLGYALPQQTVDLFEHMAACRSCVLRENNDPHLCSVAEAIEYPEPRP